MPKKGSKKSTDPTKKCRSQPSSLYCRKRVFQASPLSKAKNRSMTRAKLVRNRRGKVVSAKKSSRERTRYESGQNPLRVWNTAARMKLEELNRDPSYIPF